MRKAGWCLGLLLVLALPAGAQVPALLPGRWEVYQISFLAPATVPDSVRAHLDDPQVAGLNLAIMAGQAQLVVEFRTDGSYQFSVVQGSERVRAEAGTYGVVAGTVQARSSGTESSSFTNQKITKLTKRTLLLTFPAGPTLPGVEEEVEYRRLKAR